MLQVEIVNAFEGEEGLKAFKEWVMTPDKDVLAEAQRVGSRGRKAKDAEVQPEGEVGLFFTLKHWKSVLYC